MMALLSGLFSQVWGYLAAGALVIAGLLWVRQTGVNAQKVADLTNVQKDESVAHAVETTVADMSVQQLDSIVRKPNTNNG